MANFAQAAGGAAQIAQMLYGGGGGQQPPLQTMQPARPTRGGVIPGSGGLTLTGNPQFDQMMSGEFMRYAELWGRKYAELKRANPDLSNEEIVSQIGPHPSKVSKFTDFIDKLGTLAEDPSEKQHQRQLEIIREQHKLNREGIGEQQAFQMSLEALREEREERRAKMQMEFTASEGEKTREFNREMTAEERAIRAAEHAESIGLQKEGMGLQKEQFGFQKEQAEEEKKYRPTPKQVELRNQLELEKLQKELMDTDEKDAVVNLGKHRDVKMREYNQNREAFIAASAEKIYSSSQVPITYAEAVKQAKDAADVMFTEPDMTELIGIYEESGYLSAETAKKLRARLGIEDEEAKAKARSDAELEKEKERTRLEERRRAVAKRVAEERKLDSAKKRSEQELKSDLGTRMSNF